jgi:hypothetical protein
MSIITNLQLNFDWKKTKKKNFFLLFLIENKKKS